MYCPFCHQDETKVIDSRLVNDGQQVWRRRECVACSMRFTSYETAELNLPKIVKRDGSRQSFNEEKLRSGIMRALEKRPVSTEDCETAIAGIKKLLLASGEREITSNQLGEWVMEALKALDEVAFVRFASVYRRFQDINEFYDEIKNLKQKETV